MSDSGSYDLPPGFQPAHLPDERPHIDPPRHTQPQQPADHGDATTHTHPTSRTPTPASSPSGDLAVGDGSGDLPPGYTPPVEHFPPTAATTSASAGQHRRPSAAPSPFGLAIPAGGLLAVVGSIQTWSTGKVGRKKVSYNGFQHGHNGVLLVVVGIVLLGIGFVVVRSGRHVAASIGAAVLGAVASVIAVVDLADIANHSDGFVAAATVGPGLPIALLGGVLALAGGVGTVVRR